MNPTIPKNIINDEQSGPYEPTKGVKAHLPLDCLCGPFRSPLVTFLGVVGFVSLKSLQRYQLCHHQSFDVILMFFFSILLFLLSLLNVVFIKFVIWKNTWYLWHVNCKYHLQFSKLCYFHRYLCVMLFYDIIFFLLC